MRRLIFAFFMMFLVMPALVAEANLSRGSLATRALFPVEVQWPEVHFQTSGSPGEQGLILAQNIDEGLAPEGVTDGSQPSETSDVGRSDGDGFQGGSTFDHFQDPRAVGAGITSDWPVEYTHEGAGQEEMDHYNLMMRAWQKN